MSQKRKAYKDIKDKILQDICLTYNREVTVYGLEQFKKEANVRYISDRDLIRILDRAYIEIVLSISYTYHEARKMS